MSQADRIPARSAHLSGQEPCASASGPPPGKGCGSRAARPRAPTHRGGGGEEPPPSLRPRERHLPSGAGLPRAGGGLLASFSDCRPLSSRL